MTWYSVHAVVTTKRIDNKGYISIYENVFLVEAADRKEAYKKGEIYAKAEPEAADNIFLDNKPATSKFIGIRKIINISNPVEFESTDQDRPVSGIKCTTIKYKIKSEELNELFMGDKRVGIKYLE